MDVSIIIPSRNESFLNKTLNSIIENAGSDYEVIVVLEEGKPDDLIDHERIRYLHNPEAVGMRVAINQGAKEAKGKYLMKCDAHCAFGKEFDLRMIEDCKENWVMVPRRYGVDKRNWTRDKSKIYEFQYITRPDDPRYVFKGADWPEYGVRANKKLVAIMTTQGSCWFMHKSWFEKIGGLDDKGYGSMGREAQEISLKTWGNGGKLILTRRTWYAHKKKRVVERGYKRIPRTQAREHLIETYKDSDELKQLVKRFAPVPGWHTSWESVKNNRYIVEKHKLGGLTEYPIRIKGFNRSSGLIGLWNELGYKVGCEVGVEFGKYSELMYQKIPDLKLYLVDPWFDYKGVRKIRGKRHESAFNDAHRRLDQYNPTFLRKSTEEAVHDNDVPDNSLDFVYIDGNHKYDYVLLDIIMWTRKVKPGGMISGHDYFHSGRSECAAKVAVDDYTRYHKVAPWFITDKKAYERKGDRHASWFWIKP